MINKKLNKKKVYSCTYKMTYNSDSVIKMYTDDDNIVILNNNDDLHYIGFGLRNKCGTIIIFYNKGIKNYTHIIENLFNLYTRNFYELINFRRFFIKKHNLVY